MTHIATPCVLWTGPRNNNGYGVASVRGRAVMAHRLAYEQAYGPIPHGLVLDHLCRVRACCNPQHLEPVTFQENVLRGESPSADNARKTTCPEGHPYDAVTAKGWRVCRSCANQRRSRNKRLARQRAAAS